MSRWISQPNIHTVFCRSGIAALAICGSCYFVFGSEDEAANVRNKYDYRDGSWKAWRTPQRDAVNTLYLLLKHSGIDCSYKDVHDVFGGDERRRNLVEIRDAARRLGLNVSVYRCTLVSLDSVRVPIIAHTEGMGSDGGGFCVVLPIRNKSELHVIGGYTTRLGSVNADSFRRDWDGFILKPEHESIRLHWVLAGFTFLLFVAGRVLAVSRRTAGSDKDE